jgi:cell wall-associated NlpC family hydrolase
VTTPTSLATAPSPLGTQTPQQATPVATSANPNIDSSYVNLGNQTPPPAATLVYTPDVKILIARGNKQYDVSADVIAFSVTRVENSVSSAVFRLSNKPDPNNPNNNEGRYTPLFAPMDRVTIFLKRTEFIQVFSGYLDAVPLLQLYPGAVDFRASCTLKRLLHTWWDPGLPASMGIFDQIGNQSSVEENDIGAPGLPDAGLTSTLRRLLTEVGNWNSADIKIQQFPLGYYNYMEQQIQQYSGTDASVQQFRAMLLGFGDTSGGTGADAGRQLGVTQGGYNILDPESRKLAVIATVDSFGLGIDNTNLGLGQGVNTAATAAGSTIGKDQQNWAAVQEIGKNYATAATNNDAAVQCFMTIYAESSWMMYSNPSVPDSPNYPNDGTPPGGGDGTSVGLYQQQNNWGTTDQRMNVQESTGMFLNALNKLDWRNMDRATACQAVQQSGTSSGSQYKAFEQISVTEVQALRTGTGTASGTGGTSGTAAGPVGAIAPAPMIAGLTGAAPSVGIPTTNGMPSPSAAGALANRPQFDTQGAINFGMTKVGLPYGWGDTGPGSYDCSGLTQACYASIGIAIGRTTQLQNSAGQHITMASAVPGDLLQPADQSHVVMYLGGNQILEAPQQGQNIHVTNLYFTPAYVLHFPPAQYGGPGVAPFNPAPTSPGAPPGTVAQGGSGGGTVQTSSTEPIARNLFSYMFDPGEFTSAVSMLYGIGTAADGSGSPREAAFINDEPLIQSVVSVATAGLRNFQSMPNGGFMAYYPDYFGLDGRDAQIDVQDIELIDAKINWNDDALATHVYVAGSQLPRGASMGVTGWLGTKGIATVENQWLFSRMTAMAPKVKGAEMLTGADIMQRYGARVLVQDMSNVIPGAMEFLCALQLFMTKWAQQYSTTITTTFLPELYPSMRINLVGHNLQVYVSSVTHSGDFENGFTTSATICAPSQPTITSRVATDLSSQMTSAVTDVLSAAQQAAGWMS